MSRPVDRTTSLRRLALPLASAIAGLLPAALLGADTAAPREGFPAPSAEITVASVEVPVVHLATGTVRPRLEASIMAQAGGRILEVVGREGERVAAGTILVRIEDRELESRLAQARQGVEAAEAGRRQAEEAGRGAAAALDAASKEVERIRRFVTQSAATARDLEGAEARFLGAKAEAGRLEHGVAEAVAGVARAREAVREVEILLGRSKVEAPFAGVISRRLVEPGDLAWPSRPLLQLMDPDDLRLEAQVREGLVGRLAPGFEATLSVDALAWTTRGTVEEIVPLSDPATRKFTVKVRLPPRPGLLPGMFGRLEVPSGIRRTMLVPEDSLIAAGQLDLVQVRSGPEWRPRLVRLGARFPEGREILSGLVPGERIGRRP